MSHGDGRVVPKVPWSVPFAALPIFMSPQVLPWQGQRTRDDGNLLPSQARRQESGILVGPGLC